MRASFIVPCRNKERHVAACARSVLAQTEPCDIYFSDQGSTDATRSILADLVGGYSGHHKVYLLDCPHTHRRGRLGMNAHVNWLMLEAGIDGDLIIQCSADDLNHPDRVKYTKRAFEEHNPSWIGTQVQYLDPSGIDKSTFTDFPNRATRWISPEEAIKHQIGSCGSSAWARDLYEKHGPLVGFEQDDMILPSMALTERGMYFIDLPLHTYVRHASLDNTGFQGQIAAAESDEHRDQLVEINDFVHVRNWTRVLQRWQEHVTWKAKLEGDQAVCMALMEKIVVCAHGYAYVREALILSEIPTIMPRI